MAGRRASPTEEKEVLNDVRSLPAVQFLTLDASALTPVEQAECACQGGVRWIQLRAKGLSLDAWISLASQVVAVAHAHGAICTINDSPDVALASAADGVHLGKGDASPASARKLLGPHKLIGVTLNSLDDLWRLAEGSPDYVGVGPFRSTLTKVGHAPVHTEASLRDLIAAAAPLPAYVIGGVTAADFSLLKSLGASGAAMSGAIARTTEPLSAAKVITTAGQVCWDHQPRA